MLRASRRRQGRAQRQAPPLRFGRSLGEVGKGLTITAMLAACRGNARGLRISELIAVTVRDLRPQLDRTDLLHLSHFKTDQEGWRLDVGVGGVALRAAVAGA